jgi:NADPH-dependent 2,4-dienoyl-CoA reductase/sulfur reductase-like enzyme
MQRILIVGAGFAGMYAALCAARLRDEHGVSSDTLEIAVVAPEPRLVIRPRLYERAPETMVAPLGKLFEALDIRYEQGRVEIIDSAGKSTVIVGPDGARRSLSYDRLVLAAGSQGFKPGHPRALTSTASPSIRSKSDRPRPPTSPPLAKQANLGGPRHGGRLRRRLHRHRDRHRNAVASARHPRAEGRTSALSSSTATKSSRRRWAPIRVR